MEKKYNKLVRDNIPNIISNDNEIPITRILSDDEFKTELYKKLSEECKEVLNSKTKKRNYWRISWHIRSNQINSKIKWRRIRENN